MVNQSIHTLDINNVRDLILSQGLLRAKCVENLMDAHSGVKLNAFEGRGVFLIYWDTRGRWKGREEGFG